MLIEAAKGGHTNVVTMLIDYPNSLVMAAAAASGGPPGGPNPDAAAQAAAGMWTLDTNLIFTTSLCSSGLFSQLSLSMTNA